MQETNAKGQISTCTHVKMFSRKEQNHNKIFFFSFYTAGLADSNVICRQIYEVVKFENGATGIIMSFSLE